MSDYTTMYQKLLQRAEKDTNRITDKDGNVFILDPENETVTPISGPNISTSAGIAITKGHKDYEQTLVNLLADTTAPSPNPLYPEYPVYGYSDLVPEKEAEPLPLPGSTELPELPSREGKVPGTRRQINAADLDNSGYVETSNAAGDNELAIWRRGGPAKDVARDPSVSQLVPGVDAEGAVLEGGQTKKTRNMAITLGAGALLSTLVGAIPGSYERGLKEDLEEEPEGMTAEQKRLMMQAQLAPVAAMSRGAMMAQQAAMASTGNVMSAAALQATRDAQNMAVVKAGQSAGMAVAAADLQTLDRNIEKQERKRAALGVAQMKRQAAAAGKISDLSIALTAVLQGKQPKSALSTLDLVIDYQVPGMTEQQAANIAMKIGNRKLSRAQIEKIYTDQGLQPPENSFFTEIS